MKMKTRACRTHDVSSKNVDLLNRLYILTKSTFHNLDPQYSQTAICIL